MKKKFWMRDFCHFSKVRLDQVFPNFLMQDIILLDMGTLHIPTDLQTHQQLTHQYLNQE